MSLMVIENGVVIGGPLTPYIRSGGNTYVGDQVGDKNTSGYYNTAVGFRALFSNTIGQFNSAVGYNALYSNDIGIGNSAVGFEALYKNTSGYYNTAVGYSALHENTSGHHNSVFGKCALDKNSTGSYNTAVGFEAGIHQADEVALETANRSVYIGAGAKGFSNSDDNSIVIGYMAVGIGANTVVIGNDGIVITALKGKVGIGTTAPNANALLDIVSTTKAVMFPRMTTAERDAIGTPAAGMLIYNTTTNVYNFHNGTAWGAI